MDSLPLELVRLVFESCDPQSVQSLRLASGRLAAVGYEYLIPPKFTALGWRDDVKRLHSIACHDRLKGCVRSITVNFSEVHEYNARNATFFQHYAQEAEERSALLANAWLRYTQLEAQRKALGPFHDQAAAVKDAFRDLPNLSELEVTFSKCPFDIDVLQDAFEVPNCRKMDHQLACKNLNVIVTAMQKSRVSSFTVDRLPLELFRSPADRRLWFGCAEAFDRLSRLNLTLDSSAITFPAAKFKAVNGLGFVLQRSPNLTHLSLAFHNYAMPRDKFLLWFKELLDRAVFHRLTDLKLEGMTCDEDDLRAFLIRHGATLERLRLGGRGLAKPHEPSMGGIHLCRGTFRSFFAGLRGKLPALQRLHLEGDFEAEALDADLRESYVFHPLTDDDWNEVAPRRVRSARRTTDGSVFETFVLTGGAYPGHRVFSSTSRD